MEENVKYEIGEEPISTDDLIFYIGEKSVDLKRKIKAINNLKGKYNALYEQYKELDTRINNDNIDDNKNKELIFILKEENTYLKDQLINIKDVNKQSMNDLSQKLEKERKKNRELRDYVDKLEFNKE